MTISCSRCSSPFPATATTPIGSSRWCLARPLALALVIGGMLPGLSFGAEETSPPPEPPPDPLRPPPTTLPSRGGFLAGGDIPPSLLAPTRWRVGDFALSTNATLAAAYDDNVDADPDARDEDIFLTVSPGIRAQSLYARHSIGFGAGATAGTALKDNADDFFDWRIGADGRVDLSKIRKINGAVGYSLDTQDGEAVDAERGQVNVPIHLIDAGLSYDVSGDTIGYSVDTSLSRQDFEDRAFDDRDRTTLGLGGAVRYAMSDRLSLSAGPTYRYSAYDEAVAGDGKNRDAQTISAQIGASYKASATITTSGAIGYSYATFDDPAREDADSAIGNLGLTWEIGQGTSLALAASRTLGLTVVDDEDSRTTTSGLATLSHRIDLGSRSALSSSLSYGISNYSDLDRTDHNVVASLGYAYRLAEHVFFSSSYRFSRRDSDDEDADYYRNLISIGITVAY